MDLAWLALAGVGAGAINAAVGSGTLLTYPALLAIGLPPVLANGTNAAGLVPGSAAGAWAYREDLRGRDVRSLVLVTAVGAAIGSALVLVFPERVFVAVVPWLIISACLLVLLGPVVRKRFAFRGRSRYLEYWLSLVGVYNGYFGAAQGVAAMGVLTSAYDPDMHKSNAVKNVLAAVGNSVAAVVFALLGVVDWRAALVLALASMVGGLVGGSFARRLPDGVLRGLVVVIGLYAAVRLLTMG